MVANVDYEHGGSGWSDEGGGCRCGDGGATDNVGPGSDDGALDAGDGGGDGDAGVPAAPCTGDNDAGGMEVADHVSGGDGAEVLRMRNMVMRSATLVMAADNGRSADGNDDWRRAWVHLLHRRRC